MKVGVQRFADLEASRSKQMSLTEESGIGAGEGSVFAADPTPSTELDVNTDVIVYTGVAILRATSSGAQVLFIQRADSKLELPTGQAQAGETEEQAAVRIAQEAGVRGIQVQAAAALGELHFKDKKIKEEEKVVRVVKRTIRVMLATPTEQFVIESREGLESREWISQVDLPKLCTGNRLQAIYRQHVHIVELALNRLAVAIPFLQAEGGRAGGNGMAGNGSFIRFFAALDFEATCWNEEESGPGARAKQDAEAEIIEFPTVLYRVDGDGLKEVGQFRR